jgi:hypothetical protein
MPLKVPYWETVEMWWQEQQNQCRTLIDDVTD